LTAGQAAAADFAMIMKSGTVKLWDEDQRLDLADRRFDGHSQRTLALAWEIRNAKEVAMGMEYLTYRHDLSDTVSGGAKTQVVLFNIKKYFSPNLVLHPYAGFGLGWGHARFDDGQGNIDRDFNLALQASGGVEFRIGNNFGIYTELKGLASGTDGEDENEFDFSGTGLMAGISLIF
jgi:hypothetical protein